jgi:hypothetical protein
MSSTAFVRTVQSQNDRFPFVASWFFSASNTNEKINRLLTHIELGIKKVSDGLWQLVNQRDGYSEDGCRATRPILLFTNVLDRSNTPPAEGGSCPPEIPLWGTVPLDQ